MERIRRILGARVPVTVRHSSAREPVNRRSQEAAHQPSQEAAYQPSQEAEQWINRGDPDVEGTREHEEEEILPAYGDRPERELKPVNQFIGRKDGEPGEDKLTMRLEIPVRTILKVIGTLIAIWLALQVMSILLLLLLAVLICLALLPPVRRLEHRGMSRVLAAATVYLGVFLVFAGFVGLIVPPLVTEIQGLIDNAPEYTESFDDVLDRYPWVRDQIDNYIDVAEDEAVPPTEEVGGSTEGAPVDAATVTEGATTVISFGANIVGGLANVFFVAVLAFYLLIEGDKTARYFARYMTPKFRYRFYRLGPELTNVLSGYVLGQAIISTVFGVYSYIVLVILDVPQPLLLAIVGAVAVAIPIVGVPVATIAAMVVALSVSWETSLIVFVAFMGYQQFENYVLLPRVYGSTLQVTSLSILVGVLVGGQLLGILGIILSLPLTAAIPVIERVWREIVPPDIDAIDRAGGVGPPVPETASRGD